MHTSKYSGLVSSMLVPDSVFFNIYGYLYMENNLTCKHSKTDTKTNYSLLGTNELSFKHE